MDTDVMKQHVAELLSQAPPAEQAGGHWLLNRLSTYREQRQQELESFLQNVDKKALKSAITACLPKGPLSPAPAQSMTRLDPQAPTGQNARTLAHIRLEELYSWSEQAGAPYAVKELHHLRIAAKRLRYTLEMFKDFFPGKWTSVLEEITAIQDELGVLHDSDVFIALLRLCLSCQDNPAYARILSRAQQAKGAWLKPELVATLLDPSATPSASERYGLERLLHKQEHLRLEQYTAFRAHWSCLEEQDFHPHVLALLE